MFQESFATADGRARFVRVEQSGPAETPDRAYPYYLTTGRTAAQYQSGNQTRRVRQLSVLEPDAFAQLHPDLAARHGIRSSELVRLTTRRGSALFRARLSAGIRADTVFVPFHWAGLSLANALTNPALDPYSRMPEFKVCAVALSVVEDPDDLVDLHAHSPPARAVPATRVATALPTSAIGGS